MAAQVDDLELRMAMDWASGSKMSSDSKTRHVCQGRSGGVSLAPGMTDKQQPRADSIGVEASFEQSAEGPQLPPACIDRSPGSRRVFFAARPAVSTAWAHAAGPGGSGWYIV